jgi:hypothetical protein
MLAEVIVGRRIFLVRESHADLGYVQKRDRICTAHLPGSSAKRDKRDGVSKQTTKRPDLDSITVEQ